MTDSTKKTIVTPAKKKNKLGVVIGRFQPLHNGHIELLLKAKEESEHVLVILGSRNRAADFNNPLNINDRRSILKAALDAIEYGMFKTYCPKDLDNDEAWVENLIGTMQNASDDCDPNEVSIYTSAKDQEFYQNNFINPITVVDAKDGLSATSIRELFYAGAMNTLKPLVPLASYSTLENLSKSPDYQILVNEKIACEAGKAKAMLSHAFNNPIEPVVHAVVLAEFDNVAHVLVVRRAGARGFGQLAIPGGYMNHDETTLDGALRELREETGLDLKNQAAGMLSMYLSENLGDLSTRTLGINYLFALRIDDPEDAEFTGYTDDAGEISEVLWVTLNSITKDETILFYNHNDIVRRLLSLVKQEITKEDQVNQGNQETQETPGNTDG